MVKEIHRVYPAGPAPGEDNSRWREKTMIWLPEGNGKIMLLMTEDEIAMMNRIRKEQPGIEAMDLIFKMKEEGAFPGMPTREEAEKLMALNRQRRATE